MIRASDIHHADNKNPKISLITQIATITATMDISVDTIDDVICVLIVF